MKKENLKNANTCTEQREVKIGKTIFTVNTVFTGVETFETTIVDWAKKKTFADMKV